MLAILGRGIVEKDGVWTLTDDLEVCDDNGAHLPVWVPADDENQNCLIGGGWMNLDAGCMLVIEHNPIIVVCAYGGRSPYLQAVNGPSESEIMSDFLRALFQHPNIPVPRKEGSGYPYVEVWPREKIVPGRSNTYRELQNIFEFAVERGLTKVGVVTVAVHYARTLLMAQRHLVKPEFAHLELQCFVSEDVLLRASKEDYESCIRAMHGSKAFMRTFGREIHGINCLLAGDY